LVAVDDVTNDPQLALVRQHLPPDLRSVFAVPFVVGERCLGVVLVQSSRVSRPDEVARATAALLARTAALLLLPHFDHEPTFRRAGVRPEAAGSDSPGHGSSLILVVEDDVATAKSLADALVEEGYRVSVVTDGHDGLRQASEEPPDLVLLDVYLPGMSGFDAATSLRQLSSMRGVPIVFLSGAEDLPTRVRNVHLEHVDFMPKPFGLEELLVRIHQALRQKHDRQILQEAAEYDELTGLGNLRLLHRCMTTERARFARYGHPLAVAMIDVDKLKLVNDTHGHVAGSQMLRDIAHVLQRQARDTDVIVRYGGDEFVALLPHTRLADARVFGKRVLLEVNALAETGLGTTVSVGVAALTRPRSKESIEDLLKRADRAAYRAKQAGGHRVCVDDDEPT
jgi:diguanylate cyclase (GGDEF)-like protein